MRDFTFTLGILALFAVAAPALGETRPVEGSVEARKLVVVPGEPARVKAWPCDTCAPETFELDPQVRLFVKGEPVSPDQLLRRQGHAGTLIYDLQSGRAVRLRW